jgi:uncharacterized repeat protein (TIGR02543 family)
MLKTCDMRFRKVPATGRAFLLWFFATALIVLSMAVSPAVAFADENQDIPEGVITFVDADEASADPVATEPAAESASNQQEQIPEGIIEFDEPEVLDETQGASNEIPEVENAQAQEQAPEAKQETNAGEDASTESADETLKQETAQATPEEQDKAQNGSDSELASNDSADETPQQAVNEEPAINPEPSDDEPADAPASSEPATQDPIITDAPANAPPAENAASSASPDVNASTNAHNSNTQNAQQPVAASNGSSASAANNVVGAASNTIKAQSTVSVRFVFGGFVYENSGATAVVSDAYPNPSIGDIFTDSTRDGEGLDEIDQWEMGDYNASSYDSGWTDGSGVLTGSWLSCVLSMDEDDELPVLYRLGYRFAGWVHLEEYANKPAITAYSCPSDFIEEGTVETSMTLVASWAPWTNRSIIGWVEYTPSNDEDAAEIKFNYPDFDSIYWNTEVELPDVISTPGHYGYSIDESGCFEDGGKTYVFAGYVIDANSLGDTEHCVDKSTYWLANKSDAYGAIPIIPAGKYQFGEIWNLAYGGTLPGTRYYPGSTYYPQGRDMDTEWDESLYDYGLSLRAVFKEKVEESKTYSVTYTNVNNSGSATSEFTVVTHGNTGTLTEKAIDIPSGWSTPATSTDPGYDYEFIGWSRTAKTPSSSVTADFAKDGSLNGVGGTGTPVDGGSYTLFAVWKKTPEKYYVSYKANKPSGMSGPSDKDKTEHYVYNASSTSDPVAGMSILGITSNPTGFEFAGWALNANATTPDITVAQIQAGKAFSGIWGAGTPKAGSGSEAGTEANPYLLYAVWNALTYKINFELGDANASTTTTITNPYVNGKSAADLSSLTKSDGTAATAPTKDTVKNAGYVFDGWNATKKNGSSITAFKAADKNGSLTSAFKTAVAAGDEYTFTAIWKEVTYTINWYSKWVAASGSYTPDTNQTNTNTRAPASGLKMSANASNTLSSFAPGKPYTDEVTISGKKYTWSDWYITVNGLNWQVATGGSGTAISGKTFKDLLETSGVNVTVNEGALTGTITILGVWTSTDVITITYEYMNSPKQKSGTSTSIDKGQSYTIDKDGGSYSGWTFEGWNTKADGTGDSYQMGDTIPASKLNYSITLTGQWRKNQVKFNLLPGVGSGVSAEGIDLKAKTDPKASVDENVDINVLTTGTPYRKGYTFSGWSKSFNGPVIIGPTAATTYKVVEADATTDGTTMDLYATWTPWTYTVRYWPKPSTDTDSANGVTMYKQVTANDWDTLGTPITDPSYTWSAKTAGSDTGLDNPDIILVRDWYHDRGEVRWAIKNSSTPITNSNSLESLYDLEVAIDGRNNQILDLYAIWTPITYTVNYESKSVHGSVTPVTETVNLATGKDSDVKGSTASVLTAGYDLAIPTWTDLAGNAVTGSSTTAKQAFYRPTITYLQQLYKAVPGSDSCTFYARFTEAKYAYKIQAYMQKADGTWNTAFTTPNDVEIIMPGGVKLEAAYGAKVKASDIITGTTISDINGKPLSDIVLYALQSDGTNNGLMSGAISNRYLFELDTSQGSQEIPSISNVEGNNILKLYYKRTTFNLDPEFKTKSADGVTTAGAPTSVKTTAASHVNDGNATTQLRWGQSIKLTAPVAPGYTFAWAISTPAGSTSPLTQPTSLTDGSVAINANDMYRLAVATVASNAVLTGTFTVIQYTITLNDGPNTTEDWYGGEGTAAASLKTNHTASKKFSADQKLGAWVPGVNDNGSYQYYFAGWRDEDDPESIIATDVLRTMPTTGNVWTKNKTFTAVWLQKVLIAYDPGDLDSYGKSKATWIFTKRSLGNTDFNEYGPTGTYLSETPAKFSQLVGQVDDLGNPMGADGWEFDYWTVSGDTKNWRYGQVKPYTGDGVPQPDGWFLDGDGGTETSGRTGVNLASSYTFIAHWKPVAQIVEFLNAGPELKNDKNTDTITVVVPNLGKTYNTDDEVNLSEYTPTSVPEGYDFAGWQWKLLNETGGEVESGTYAPGSKFRVKNGARTVLNPYFHEKTYTFKYEVASTNSGWGTITPATSDTVFAVKHNGINAHTADTSNAVAYEFANWTYNSAQVTKDAEINASKMGIAATDVITADRTYYANFTAKPYTILFDSKGVADADGGGYTTMEGSSVTASGTGYNINNGFDVAWNTKIQGTVTVVVPEGYELAGWIVDNAGAPQVFTGGNASNNQGIYNYPVVQNVTMTAYFKVSDLKKYTVHYNFDPGNPTTGYTGPASKNVAWGESVLPSAPHNDPKQAGFKFEGWYIDAARTISITTGDVEDKFGKIYTKLGELGAAKPNYDPDTFAITIYAKWSAEKFTVSYDLEGNVPDNPATTFDDVEQHIAIASKTDVAWNDTADTFKIEAGPATFERAGYTLKGWSATYGTTESSSNVLNSDTYGKLAGGQDTNKVVVLHAIWESVPLKVKYVYEDGFAGAGATPDMIVTKGWAEVVDYYTLGAAKTYTGYKFDGYTVEYVITSPTPGTQYSSLTKAQDLTIRDIVEGNTTSLGTVPIIVFTAKWTAESTYYFQDRFIAVDGTSSDKTATAPATVDGNTIVKFSEKYPSSTSKYEDQGYDFDNHVATNPYFNQYTLTEKTITSGSSVPYYVYYLERSYSIGFYTNGTDATSSYITSGNAWNSAPAKLPATEPTKAGFKFDGWYLTTTNSADDGVKLDGTKSIAATGVFATAPANKSTLKAIAKWIEDVATIEWDAAANGTTNPAPGSVTRAATDATPVNTIKAVPADGGDYVFDKWTYEYTDPSDPATPKTGDVSASSKFATLGGTDNDELTPIPWVMHTGEGSVWHNIKFTAHFALSSALTVTINYYLENADMAGQPVEVKYELKDTKTKRDAVDGQYYTFTPVIPDGYVFNEGLTKSKDSNIVISGGDVSKMYNFVDETSKVFNLYLDALSHNVTYKYVEADGTDQTPPTGADPLNNPPFNIGSFKTGQTYTVSNAPTLEGWDFKGWYLSDNYGGTNMSGTSFKMGDKDIVFVGTWERKNRHVDFINASASSPAVAAGCTISQTSGGYTVQDGSKVKTAINPAATTLSELGVNYSNAGKAYTLTGWEVLVDGEVKSTIGLSDPLDYEVHSDVTFRAVWSETYAVTYTRGAHGSFTDSVVTTKPYVEFSQLADGAAMPAYDGTMDAGKPNANPGWEWVGWGVKNGSTWTYYFANEADIDYSGTTGTNVTTGLPATVNSNIEFVGFYKALERTLYFSMHEYDSGTPAGTESSKTFADDPQPTLRDGVAASYTVKTGKNATMLGTSGDPKVNDVIRAGYTLVGWTDGTKTYTPDSTTEFVMPDGPTTQYVYLYPVFSFGNVSIAYKVVTEHATWGNLDNVDDQLSAPTDTLDGSTPTAMPGYEFDYWTKGSDTTPLTAADGLQAGGKLVPIGAAGNVTFYAHFKQKTYDVTLVKNPSPIGDEEILPATTTFTGKVWTDDIELGKPTRYGYDFKGWDVYETADWTANGTSATKLHAGVPEGTIKVSALSNTSGTATSLTLVPSWTAKAYKVIFNDGKTSGTGAITGMPTTNPRNCEFSSDDIDASNPKREGYTFGGWANSVNSAKNVAAGVTTLKYSDLVNDENDTEVTLTAIWKAIAHTLTYVKGDGDTWSTDTSKYPTGDPVNTASADPVAPISTEVDAVINLRTGGALTHAGSKLVGWKHGTTEYRFDAGTTFVMPNEDVTLTPIWEMSGDYNVIFLPGAGVTDAEKMPVNRTGISFLTDDIDMHAPSRAGWTFLGWQSDVTSVSNPPAGTGKKYSDLVNGDDSIKTVTLTARWDQTNDYKVIFDKNAGETEYITNMPPNPQEDLAWDSNVTTANISGNPGRAGYIFDGWIIRDTNGDAIGGTDVTFYNGSSAKFSSLAQGEDLPERKILTLVAHWSPITYTVEFIDNKPSMATGEVSGMPTTNPITNLNYDSTGIVAPTLTLEGYDFNGWMNSATGSIIAAGTYDYAELCNNNDMVLKVTLTADWSAKPHDLVYSIGEGDTWSTTPGDYPVTEPAVNGANNPTAAIKTKTDAIIDLRGPKTALRGGSVLVGWKDSTDGTEYRFANGDTTLKVPNRDVTLTPIFEEKETYKVVFHANDSEGRTKVDMSTMPANRTNIKYSTEVKLDNPLKPGNPPVRPGYIFAGWTNDSGADVGPTVTSETFAKLAGFNFEVETVNLTAKWLKDTGFKVTYSDGVPSGATTPFTGTLPANIPSLGFDDTVPQTELNTTGTDRVGFTFDGWKITNDADGTTIATVTSGYADTVYSAIVNGNAEIRAITFTAMWSGTPYQLTYHKENGTWVPANITDEGKSTPDQALTYKCEQDVPLRLANTMKREGYTLVGWANGTNKLDAGYIEYKFASSTSFSMPAHNVDLYPLWDAKTYTIVFVEKPYNDTGSSAVNLSTMPTSPQTGEYNDTFTYGAPTRTGYDFGGWDVYKTDEYEADPATASLLQHVGEGTGTYASLAKSADIDGLTMVAYWTPQKLGVTYVLDLADKASWVTENIKDAGKDTPTKLISYEMDQTVNLREANTVARKGYVLIGWKEDNSPSVTTAKYPFDADGHASFTMPANNVYLYAVWQIKDGYTVTFDGNAPTENLAPGAKLENVPDDQPIAPLKLTWEGSTSRVDTHSPTFIGYEFMGWDVYGSDGVKINSSPLIGPEYYFNTLAITDTPEHEHLRLVANWQPARIYSVLFKDNVDAGDTPVTVGTMPSDQTGILYVDVVDYHAPSRVGYTFDGWDVTDITDPMDEQFVSTIAAEDVGSNPYYVLAGNNAARKTLQLTARWIEKTGYNVHFVDKPESDTGATPVNMGSLSDYINIAWDDEVIAYPAPTRSGYDFVHWAVTDTTDPDDPANIGSATAGSYRYSTLARNRTDDTIMDITLTAIWKAHEWTVTYVNSSDKGPGTWVKANIGDAGKNTPDAPVTYAVDDTITLRDRTTLIMSGYKLVGWQDDEVAPTNTYMLDTVTEFIMPDHDVNLYPIWAPKVYTVVFDGNKPAEATDASQTVTNLPPTQWAEGDAAYPLAWNGDVDTHAPKLPGYSFKGWVVEDASTTGARTGLLGDATYKFSELALTDIMEHETLKLIAQWEPAKYRVNYVDPIDATGATVATPAMIATDVTKLWSDMVSDSDPWTISNPAYAGKSNDDWQFLGWMVFDVNTNTYVALNTIANHAYNALATYENLTLADSATADETPALVLYASWARRVPFVVDFMKRDASGNDTVESSETLVGLDGQIIETTVVDELGKTWKAYILNTVGPNHGIPGYKYNATLSDPYVVGTLNAKDAEPLHVKLIYTELADYEIVYDAAPGASVSDPTRHTSTKGSLKWEDAGSSFVPNDSEWAYVGHKIVGWTYGPTGVEFNFDPSVKFSAIAEAIYGTVDGTEGRDVDGDGTVEKPVTLFAKWAERTDYKVKYDDNYAVDDGKVKSGITDGRFLERVADATYTPATKEDVAWSATEIEPTETDKIKKPGVKDGIELYTIEGWNYLSKDGVQKPAEGLSFAQIVADMFDGEPTDNEITLYARYKEIAIEIKYTPVLSDDDGNVISTGGSAAGTVSISLETPDAVTGTIQGSTATPNRGYHFVGWRRASDGEILLLNASGTLSGMASKIGYNVLPDGLGGATLLLAAQNTDDGYWHEEEYYALFAQNEMAILHYDKNAEDATGSIPDVEAPYETLIDLSDGSGFKRTYWTLVSWNTKPDGTGTTYALGQNGWEMPKGETTLYAQWVRNKVKLTYEPGGPDVTGIPEGVEDEWGTKHPVSDQQPKRDHYTFVGWNTKEDGTGTWWHPGDEIELPGDGVHLYAQWEINKYPVSVDPGPYTGGKVTYPGEGTWVIEHGGHLPEGYVTATPESGYHVVGWHYTMTDEYGNVTTGIVSDPTELVVIGKVTFSAIFEADPVDEPMAPYEGYSGNGGLTPQTGDMNLVLVLAISGMAAMTLLLLIVAARRRRKEE